MWPESPNIREPAWRKCNPRGTAVIEAEHFSTSGPGWTVECVKEPGVMSRTKQTKLKLEASSSLPYS